MLSRQERVELFMSLFKGRTDVFARRWEKWNGGVSGYAPVYTDQDKESYVPLTNDWVEKHLIGTATLGVYPLLKDNTSNFIVADFDGDGWQSAVRKFLDVCTKHALPVATERSRSGNGAHVWCFFDAPYPANGNICTICHERALNNLIAYPLSILQPLKRNRAPNAQASARPWY